LPRSNLSQYSNRFQPQVSTLKTNTRGKGVEKDTKGKSVEKESSKVRPTIKCYKCQGYRHIAANYSNLVKIALINGVLVAESESDSDKFIYQEKEKESNIDEEITGDVGLNCIKPTPSTHLSVFRCHKQQKRMIGEELQPSTCSPKLEIRTIR